MRLPLSLILAFVTLLSAYSQPALYNGVEVGDTLPSFIISTKEGSVFSSKQTIGKPIVIIFFNTRCFDCRKELPVIEAMYKKYKSQITFIGISRAETDESIAHFWKNNQITFPYSAQTDRAIYHLFAQKTIPRIYITDSSGVVRYSFAAKVKKRKLQKSLQKIIEKEIN